ncbi:DUF397 domain-containing protein [Streptomyces sp. NPDC056460]|uniref:DUF397 domain-containing protein n=1 Tax=Streptomyces sp. NPDC056460 TaxID=3345825 RepID=UPI00367DC7BA
MRAYDLTHAHWFKSSYSNGEGGDCVEVSYDFTDAAWRKSSYSDGDGGNCLEVLDGVTGVVPVRDSKNPTGPALLVPTAVWTAFVAGLKR